MLVQYQSVPLGPYSCLSAKTSVYTALIGSGVVRSRGEIVISFALLSAADLTQQCP